MFDLIFLLVGKSKLLDFVISSFKSLCVWFHNSHIFKHFLWITKANLSISRVTHFLKQKGSFLFPWIINFWLTEIYLIIWHQEPNKFILHFKRTITNRLISNPKKCKASFLSRHGTLQKGECCLWQNKSVYKEQNYQHQYNIYEQRVKVKYQWLRI